MITETREPSSESGVAAPTTATTDAARKAKLQERRYRWQWNYRLLTWSLGVLVLVCGVSAVSYWDPRHHGSVFIFIEAALGLALAVILFRRFEARWVRIVLGLLILAYLAVPVYFTLQLGGHDAHL